MNTKNLKPFNLKAALKGEPVMLRDRTKAYVRSWGLHGKYWERIDSGIDIIGMWPKTHMVNGFEVPAPETEEPAYGCEYFAPDILCDLLLYDKNRWDGHSYDSKMLKRGLVFLNKDDAVANAKAMLGINPYEETKNEH